SSAEADTTSASAVTISAASRLSQLSPYMRCSQPIPPPSVEPPTPSAETVAPVTARPAALPAELIPPTFTSKQLRGCPFVLCRVRLDDRLRADAFSQWALFVLSRRGINAGQNQWSGAGSNCRPAAFRTEDHRAGVAMAVSLPAQWSVVDADRTPARA